MAARGALWLSVSAWSAKGAQTAALLVLARVLAPAQFGILAIAALTSNVMTSLGRLGVGDALTYLSELAGDAFRTALSMVLAGGIALMAVAWALAPAIASFFHSPGATFVLRGFALCIPFDAITHVPVARLTRSLRFARRTATDALPAAVGAAVTIGVVVSGHPLGGLVAGQIAGSVTGAAVAFLLGPGCLPGWDTAIARRLLRYGGYLSAADLVNVGLLNVDYLIVGHVLGPAALGLYSLAYRICFLPYLSIAFVANGAVFPYYCRLPSKQAIGRAAESVYGLITAISMPWFAGLVLFAGDIGLLGAKWAPAVGPVRFLAVYGLLLSLILTALQVLKAVGRSALVLGSRALHLTILTAVLAGTVRMGITTVALDQAVVAGLVALITGWWIVRHASVRPAALAASAGLPLLGALGMLCVTVLLGLIPSLHAAPSWTSLLVVGSVALAAYAGISALVMPQRFRAGWAALRGRPGTAEQAADAPEPSSYRQSHLGAGKALSYDEDLWDPRAAKGLDWLVEQRLLEGIVCDGMGPGGSRAADFACGTGRVLEFLGRYFPAPVGIDVSPDMLALARDRCPGAPVILGDVTTDPGIAPGPFDLITAFRFFLNAEPGLRSEVLAWMRESLRPDGLVVANFHLNPRSLRGTYLRIRMRRAGRPPMVSVGQARRLFESHGFEVRAMLGYSFLPYRRTGRTLLAPVARRTVELQLAGRKVLLPVAGSFVLVASREQGGQAG